jgi:hypothetical protein
MSCTSKSELNFVAKFSFRDKDSEKMLDFLPRAYLFL